MSTKPKLISLYADAATKAILEQMASAEDRTLVGQLRVIIREAAEKRGIDMSSIWPDEVVTAHN